jgi:hypothetical protein
MTVKNIDEGIIVDAHSGVSGMMAELGRAYYSGQEIMRGPFSIWSKLVVDSHCDIQGAFDTINKELEGGQIVGCQDRRHL